MNPAIKYVAQAAEVLQLLACIAFLTPFYFVWAEREVNRVGI